METSKKHWFFQYSYDYLHKYLSGKGMSEHTKRSYADALTLFRRYAFEKHSLGVDDLQFEHMTFDFLVGFMHWLKENNGKNRSASTINHRISSVKNYIKFAMSKDVSVASIWLSLAAVPRFKEVKFQKEIFSEETLAAILESPNRKTRKGIRDLNLLILLYDTACRVDEILSLNKYDIRLSGQHPQILVKGKGRKERAIPLMERTVEHLKRYIKLFHSHSSPDTDLLFYTVIKNQTGKISQDTVSRLIHEYSTIAAQTCQDMPKNVYSHMFRRTRATHLYQKGYDIYLISRFLGHESIETTKEYLAPSMEQLKEMIEKGIPEKIAVHKEDSSYIDYERRRAQLCGIR